jgi:lipid-A-disaccharide synthase
VKASAAQDNGVRRLLVSAGEPSGDQFVGRVLSHLAAAPTATTWESFGLAGDRAQAAGCELLAHVAGTAKMANLGALSLAPRLAMLRRRLLQAPSDAALLMSYSSFNTSLLKGLAENRTGVVFVAPPQIWAWRLERGQKVARSGATIACILPFEVPIWQHFGARAVYIGHPGLELPITPSRRPIRASDWFDVALLPGSRAQEISVHLPIMLAATAHLPRRVLLLAEGLPLAREHWARMEAEGAGVTVRRQADTQACNLQTDAALACSGTVTMELALSQIPTVVLYRTGRATDWVLRRLVSVPFAALPNLVVGREVMPECIGVDATPVTVRRKLDELLQRREASIQRLACVREALSVGTMKTSLQTPSQMAAALLEGVARGNQERALGTHEG